MMRGVAFCLGCAAMLLLGSCASVEYVYDPNAGKQLGDTTIADAALPEGKTQAMIVVGHVELVAKDGTCTSLKRGMIFGEGATIRTVKGANALLVMSNGAVIKESENSVLTFQHFRQTGYNQESEGAFLRLSKDPSKSNSQLNLTSGMATIEVKKLDIEDGSRFAINTPAGIFNVAGTILEISAGTDSNGHANAVAANCITGTVDFRPTVRVTASQALIQSLAQNGFVELKSSAQILVKLDVLDYSGKTCGNLYAAAVPIDELQKKANDLQSIVNASGSTSLFPLPAVTIAPPDTLWPNGVETVPLVPLPLPTKDIEHADGCS